MEGGHSWPPSDQVVEFRAKGAKHAKAERFSKDWIENVSPRWVLDLSLVPSFASVASFARVVSSGFRTSRARVPCLLWAAREFDKI